MHALEVIQREKEHAAETERLRLQSKIAEIAEEVSKKILQKEIKLREENQSKFSQMEQVKILALRLPLCITDLPGVRCFDLDSLNYSW